MNNYYYNLTTGTKESLCTLAMDKKANNWKWQATSVREEQHQNHEHKQAKEQDQLMYNFIFWVSRQQFNKLRLKLKSKSRVWPGRTLEYQGFIRINLGNKSVLPE